MITRSNDGIFKPKVSAVAWKCNKNVVEQHIEPKNVYEALQSQEWKQTMNEEFEALKRNETWDWVPHSHKYKIVGNKWVYKIKFNYDGFVHKYNAI